MFGIQLRNSIYDLYVKSTITIIMIISVAVVAATTVTTISASKYYIIDALSFRLNSA